MIHSNHNIKATQNSFLQQVIRQLPTLRYSLYIIIPLVLMREIPKYAEYITPVTNEEKLLALALIITSSTTLGYLTLRKLFYNLNKYWILGGSVAGSGLLTLGADLINLPFTWIGLLVGLSIAANLSNEIAKFDGMLYQREKRRKIRYEMFLNSEFNYNIGRNGLLRIKLYGQAIIPIRILSFSQKQTLSGFLKTKETDFIEKEKAIIINYLGKKDGWFHQYFQTKKKLLDSYINFLTGLNDLMK